MRVIGGEFRRRLLKSPPDMDTRPTPDRLRESLFNILSPRVDGAVFVDAYAGCGSVGIEALSRGARKAVFLERSRANVALIHDNLRTLNAAARAQVIHGGVTTYLGGIAADIYFLDPPYERVEEYAAALRLLEPRTGSLIVAQHASREKLADEYGALRRTRVVKQGDNSLSFYAAGV
jgi:16S rRNA (guanine966-N2)-methyltransferase